MLKSGGENTTKNPDTKMVPLWPVIILTFTYLYIFNPIWSKAMHNVIQFPEVHTTSGGKCLMLLDGNKANVDDINIFSEKLRKKLKASWISMLYYKNWIQTNWKLPCSTIKRAIPRHIGCRNTGNKVYDRKKPDRKTYKVRQVRVNNNTALICLMVQYLVVKQTFSFDPSYSNCCNIP